MNWWLLVWKLARDKAFRNAVYSILWPRIIKPFLEAVGKHLFEEAYEVMLRAVVSTEQMYMNDEIKRGEKWSKAMEIAEADAMSKGLELSQWFKDTLLQIAVGEMDQKWEELK